MGLSALGFQDAAADLVLLDGVEQRLEVALAEALVTLALDDLEERRADDVRGEELQQAAAVRRRRAVDQDLAGREPREVLAVARQAAVDLLVVGIRHAFLESDALALEGRDGGIDVVGAERDVLDPLAPVLLQVLGDLRLVVGALVCRNADLSAVAGGRKSVVSG